MGAPQAHIDLRVVFKDLWRKDSQVDLVMLLQPAKDVQILTGNVCSFGILENQRWTLCNKSDTLLQAFPSFPVAVPV